MQIIQVNIKMYLLLAGLIIPYLLLSQEKEVRNSLFIEAGVTAGPILDIYPNLPELGVAWSAGVNVAWQTAGRQYWNQAMRYPQVGVLVSVTDLGNPSVLGQEFSLVPNLAYRFARFGKFNLMGFVGIGFAFFNKPYDRIENPENKLIGSHLTNKTILGIMLEYQLDPHFSLSGAIEYIHYSNGHNQLPNVGINIPAGHLGLRYCPEGKPLTYHGPDSLAPVDKRWLVNVRLGLGVHEFGDPVKPAGGPKYPIYTGSLYASKRLGLILNLQAGIHVNYYTSFHDYLSYHDLHKEDRHWRSVSMIAFGGLEFLLGHFAFTVQMGGYLYNPTYSEIHELNQEGSGFKQEAKKYLSYKFGAAYYLFSTRTSTRFNPWAGIFLKSNAGQADFAEFSIGVAF